MRKLVWLGVCSVALGLGASVVSAQVITVAVTGHVSHIDDPSLGLTLGQAVTGSYTYDTSTPASGPTPNNGSGLVYPFASPPTNVTVSVVGGQSYQTQTSWSFQGSVLNEGPSQFNFGGVNFSSSGAIVSQLAVSITDIQSQWLHVPSLPTTAPPLSSNLTGIFYVVPPNSQGFEVQFDTATLAPAITVSPANSSFIAQQNFDAVLLLSTQLSVASMQATVNGTAIGFSYPGTCQLAAANSALRTALICPNAATVLAGFGGGPVTINWLVTLADGSTLQQSVVWSLIL